MNNQERLEFILSATDRTRAVFSSVTRSLGSLASKASIAVGVFKALTVGVAGAGLQAYRELDVASSKLSENIQAFQRYQMVVNSITPGTGIGELQEGMLTLTERFSEARSGAGEIVDIFKKLGLDSSLEGPIAQMHAARVALNNIKSESERIEFSRILFGDTDGDALLGFLRQTDESIEAITKKIDESGRLFDDKDVENMRMADRAISDLSSQIASVRDKVFAKLAPAIQKGANYLTAFLYAVSASGAVFQDSIFFKIGSYIKEKLIAAIQTAVGWLKKMWDGIKGFFSDAADEGSKTAQIITEQFEVSAKVLDVFNQKLADLRSNQKDPIYIDVRDRPKPTHIDLRNDSVYSSDINEKVDADGLENAKKQADGFRDAINNISSAVGSMGTAFTQNGSKAFKTFQRIQAAIAAVAAISAAVQAAAGAAAAGPGAALAAYTGVAAALLGAVASMKSISVGSGTTTPPGTGSFVTPNGSTSSSTRQSNNAVTATEEKRKVDLNIFADSNSLFSVENIMQIAEGLNTIPGIDLNATITS